MLRITNVEEIEDLLLYLPELVQHQQNRAPSFVDNVAQWLAALEKVFLANKLYQAAAIAMLRSSLVSAKLGQVPDGVQFKGIATRSKIRTAVAAQAVQKASEIASGIVAENRRRFAEAEAVAQQLVAVALARGLVEQRPPGISNTEYLSALRNRLMNGEFENAVLHLEGLVGPNDILILLDRALTLRRAVLSTVPG